MRRLLVAVLAAVAAASVANGLQTPDTRGARKTMAFGPILPHSRFTTLDSTAVPDFDATHVATDPIEVARRFAQQLTADYQTPGHGFYVREDSYTDKNTGVTHVYLRQTVKGVEVANGHMNINVKNGRVLSYGNSFFDGTNLSPDDVDIQGEYCEHLHNEINRQVELMCLPEGTPEWPCTTCAEPYMVPTVDSQVLHNCHYGGMGQTMFDLGRFSKDVPDDDPRQALLQFMFAAATESSDDLIDGARIYLDRMRVEPEADLASVSLGSATMRIHNVPEALSPVKARKAYVQIPNGDSTALALVWKFEVEMKDNWYEAAVSHAAPYNIVSVVDWVSDFHAPSHEHECEDAGPSDKPRATYNVFRWGVNDPSRGERTMELEYNDTLASPRGWHSLPFNNDPRCSDDKEGFKNTTTTWGNNAFTHENWEGEQNWVDNHRPEADGHMVFDSIYDPKPTLRSDALAEAKQYVDAAITQLFYTANMMHDFLYRYGFDEVSGNFQQYNFGRGGKENDGVIVNAEDGSGYNNANFLTPPDGEKPRCRMYIWTSSLPYRDGDFDAGVVIHEYAHGLSTRLTGGPADVACLGFGESGGMGEGWGDFFASVIQSTAKDHSYYAIGSWAANKTGGIRYYPYSTNRTINPSTYEFLDKPGYWGVHPAGEVWAEMLWLILDRLVAKHGFSNTTLPPLPLANGTIPTGDFYRPREYDADGKEKPLVPIHGNTLLIQLVINGMKLQPCLPSFFDARDAIISADKILTGGENECELWGGFAEAGLGPDALLENVTPWGGGERTDDFNVPPQCRQSLDSDGYVIQRPFST